ncbi:TPA: SMP-30/gluconolactonase/LRE family protein [Pseudomonas aeruginosa]|nr:SMP-30/gluconolactonase/LRE family protein [Pseudomonas aeruginosa]
MKPRVLGAAVTTGAAVLLAGCSAVPTATKAPASNACVPKDSHAEYLCGIRNVEKLIPVDNTRWAIASSTAGGPVKTPPLYFIDLDAQTYTPLDPAKIKVKPDTKTFPDCGAPDFSVMSSVGMDVRPINGKNVFYSVNHGKRMTTEVFDIDTSGTVPELTWRGCIKPPSKDWFMDDLAILSDGGMVISSFFDLTNPNFKDLMEAGTPTGKLGMWRPGKGWVEIPTGQVSAPNGVILSADEKQAFFADWGGKGLVRMDLATQKMDRVALGYRVDNILWDTKGKYILAGGQNGAVKDIFACLESDTLTNCDIPFSVVAVDPATLEPTPIFGPAKLGVMGVGTGAMQDGDYLWLTTFRSDRLPRIPYPLK